MGTNRYNVRNNGSGNNDSSSSSNNSNNDNSSNQPAHPTNDLNNSDALSHSRNLAEDSASKTPAVLPGSLATPEERRKFELEDSSVQGGVAFEGEGLAAQPRPYRSGVRRFLSENALILSTVVCIVIGFAIGLALQEVGISEEALLYIGFPGELFLRSLKATIVPIIVCMVITSTSSVDAKSNGKMAVVAVASFFLTAVLAAINALVLFLIFKPEANSLAQSGEAEFTTMLTTRDVFMDLIRNIVPDNIVSATIVQATTVYEPDEVEQVNATTNATETVIVYSRSLGEAGGVNILGLISICAAVGVAAKQTLPHDSAFLSFFQHGQQVTLHIMRWLAWATPVGVASLVAESIAGVDDISTVFNAIGRLVLCVTVGLVIHQCVILPAILFLLARKNPFLFLIRCTKPFFVSFAATATSVAIPHMIESAEKNNISKPAIRFVIPMSVTLHADGSALFMTSAALFVAQTSMASILDSAGYLIILVLSSVMSMAIPPVPSASIVNIVIILTSVNCPLNGIALLFTVEWLLDRLRSGVNAASHVMCAAYTDAICKPGNDAQSTGDNQNNLNDGLELTVVPL